jgi:hypothetical protein
MPVLSAVVPGSRGEVLDEWWECKFLEWSFCEEKEY